MKIRDVFDLTLREILENYSVAYNAECGFYYGIFKDSDIDKLFEEYNIEEYEEAFVVESVIREDLFEDEDKNVDDYKRLTNIMENLGISKKDGISES